MYTNGGNIDADDNDDDDDDNYNCDNFNKKGCKMLQSAIESHSVRVDTNSINNDDDNNYYDDHDDNNTYSNNINNDDDNKHNSNFAKKYLNSH